MEKVSIVVPVYNNLKITIDCLRDLLNTCAVETEIIVVDDASTEPVFFTISKLFPMVTVLKNDQNAGFAKTCNKGIIQAKHDMVCLLNNDVRLPNPNWLKIMVGALDKYDMTAPAGGRMTKDWEYLPGEAKSNSEEFAYLAGWALLIKRDVINKIGLIPENFGRGFFEDVAYSYFAKKAGFKIGISEGTGIQHAYHATFKLIGTNLAKEYKEKREIFLKLIEVK